MGNDWRSTASSEEEKEAGAERGGGAGRGGSRQTTWPSALLARVSKNSVAVRQQPHCTVSLINARHKAYGSGESKIKTMSEAGTKAAQSRWAGQQQPRISLQKLHDSGFRTTWSRDPRHRTQWLFPRILRGSHASCISISSSPRLFFPPRLSHNRRLSHSLSPSDNYFSIPS